MLFIKNFLTITLSLLALCVNTSIAQDAMESFNETPQEQPIVTNSNQVSDYPYEKIIRIGRSKKIFVLTNENQSYAKGDFITLLVNGQKAVRALTAKNADELNGIKVLRIYSADLFNSLGPGSSVQIIKGDDSFLDKKPEEQVTITPQIKGEENLFDETTVLNEDINLEENSKRVIKTDNIVGVHFGQIDSIDVDSESQRYSHWSAFWMYQFADNIWGELIYGQTSISAFPAEDIDTKLGSTILRLKYTIAAPYYSYIQPYVGYQLVKANSPSAGFDPDGVRTELELEAETELVEKAEKSQPIVGVTLLKRLVPGWFVKVDLGTDIFNLGICLEF